MMTRSYSELSHLNSFEERFDYLSLTGKVGEETFGLDRYLNQNFYRSYEWKRIRQQVIARDEGRDLGVIDHEIYDKIIIHHMQPMRPEDFYKHNASILNHEYLITTSLRTHNAIHFGSAELLKPRIILRRPGDTKLW